MKAARRLSSIEGSAGFTLIEVMTVSLMIVTLMALSYAPLKNFWYKQALSGAHSSLIAEIRGLQARVTSESHPLVYGIRFTTLGNMMANGQWGVVKYDPTGGAGGTPICRQISTSSFDTGVFNASVEITAPSFSSPTPDAVQTFCRTNLADESGVDLGNTASDEFAFFYARGTATGGTVTLHQPNLAATNDITMEVFPLTGRIEPL